MVNVSRILAQFGTSETGIGSTFSVAISAGRRSAMISQVSKSDEPDRIRVCESGKVAGVPDTEPTPLEAWNISRMRSCTVVERPVVRSAWLPSSCARAQLAQG